MRWEYVVVRSSVRQRYGYNVVRIIAGCDIRVWAFHNCRFSFLCEICILALGKSKAVDKSAHCILQRVWRGYNSLSIGQSVFRYSWKLSQVLGHANMFNYFLLRIDCSAKSSELSETVGHLTLLLVEFLSQVWLVGWSLWSEWIKSLVQVYRKGVNFENFWILKSVKVQNVSYKLI